MGPPPTLIDSGPLIALFDSDDRWHGPVAEWLSGNRRQFVTSWCVLTEVCATLPTRLWLQCLEFVDAGGASVINLPYAFLSKILAWQYKYADMPMDLADASLLALADHVGATDIITLDEDFTVYRVPNRLILANPLKEWWHAR